MLGRNLGVRDNTGKIIDVNATPFEGETFNQVPEQYRAGFAEFMKNNPKYRMGGQAMSPVELPDGNRIMFGDTGSAGGFREFLKGFNPDNEKNKSFLAPDKEVKTTPFLGRPPIPFMGRPATSELRPNMLGQPLPIQESPLFNQPLPFERPAPFMSNNTGLGSFNYPKPNEQLGQLNTGGLKSILDNYLNDYLDNYFKQAFNQR